ncbi:hypothetical protein AAH991_33775 [Microbispora sp. ZYX-F-249]|uniref:Secreted protein n=1 Tax=Microbispora maris TaxID=3144104 RepID=A0ABV0B186_9ACTN
MSQKWKISIIVLAAVGVISTPLIWLLDDPNAGQLTGASIQAAVGIAALVWALFQHPFQHPQKGTKDTAVGTGKARATGGGTAIAGIKRPQGRGSGSARAENTGNATADGDGSSAVSGIDYS